MMPTNFSPSITTREPTSLSAIVATASSTVASGSMVQTFRPFCSSRCLIVILRPHTVGTQLNLTPIRWGDFDLGQYDFKKRRGNVNWKLHAEPVRHSAR